MDEYELKEILVTALKVFTSHIKSLQHTGDLYYEKYCKNEAALRELKMETAEKQNIITIPER